MLQEMMFIRITEELHNNGLCTHSLDTCLGFHRVTLHLPLVFIMNQRCLLSCIKSKPTLHIFTCCLKQWCRAEACGFSSVMESVVILKTLNCLFLYASKIPAYNVQLLFSISLNYKSTWERQWKLTKHIQQQYRCNVV